MGATAAMRGPARLADRRGRTSDGNPGLGVHRGARRPDGHHALHGNRGRRGRRRNGALAILAARPVLIGALAVAFIAPTGMALLATPVETAIAAIVPGVFRAPLRTTVAAVVVVFTTAILLAIVTARLPAAVLASAAGIFPARILTIIAGVFPASFLAARSRSLATAGIALPLIATISAPPRDRRLARGDPGRRAHDGLRVRDDRPGARRGRIRGGWRPPFVPPPRRRVTRARGSAWPPRPPSGPEARAGRSERSTVARASPFGREKKDRPSRFARLGGGRTGTRRLGFAHGVFQIRRHRSALVNAIAGLTAG